MKKTLTLFLILAAMVISLTGCGGKSSKAVNYALLETTAAAMDMVSMPETAVSTDQALGGTTSVTAPQESGRKLIRTVNLSVETDTFETLLKNLEEQIADLSGYVERSDISGNSMAHEHSRRRAYMTVRVPNTNLDSFISSVDAIGNIVNKSESTNDVTLQYNDLESRKKTLSIEQDRIWALLEKADTLEAVIALEQRLSEIRYELESMESQLKLYDNQIEYSTIHIDIEEVKVYTPTSPETIGERIQKGFSQNVEALKTFTENLFVGILVTIPIWIPLSAIILVFVFLFRKKAAGKHVKKSVSSIPASYDSKSEETFTEVPKDEK